MGVASRFLADNLLTTLLCSVAISREHRQENSPFLFLCQIVDPVFLFGKSCQCCSPVHFNVFTYTCANAVRAIIASNKTIKQSASDWHSAVCNLPFEAKPKESIQQTLSEYPDMQDGPFTESVKFISQLSSKKRVHRKCLKPSGPITFFPASWTRQKHLQASCWRKARHSTCTTLCAPQIYKKPLVKDCRESLFCFQQKNPTSLLFFVILLIHKCPQYWFKKKKKKKLIYLAVARL